MHYIYRGNGAGHLLWIAGYFMTPIVKNPHGFYWVDVIDFRWSGVVSGCRAHSYFKSLCTFKIAKLFNSLWNSLVPIFFLVQSQNVSYWTRKVVALDYSSLVLLTNSIFDFGVSKLFGNISRSRFRRYICLNYALYCVKLKKLYER